MPATDVALTPAELLKALRWRYSVQKFDPTRKIPDDVWRALEEALVLTPSSWGLQPWRFYVVTDPATKDKLRAISYRQPQLTDGSHVVIFAARRGVGGADVGRFLGRVSEVKKVPMASLERLKKALTRFVETPPENFNLDHWADRQLYIAIGNFLTSAALIGVDVCPIEGFEPAKADELLGIAKDGYASVALCVAGYRAADDPDAVEPKVRYKTDDVVTHKP